MLVNWLIGVIRGERALIKCPFLFLNCFEYLILFWFKLKELCNITELIEGKGRRFIVDDVEIAVFKVDGKVYALSDVCPHQHSPIILDGFIEGDFVVCPVHGWKFYLKDGKKENGYNGLKSYPVKIQHKKVFVEVSESKFRW